MEKVIKVASHVNMTLGIFFAMIFLFLLFFSFFVVMASTGPGQAEGALMASGPQRLVGLEEDHTYNPVPVENNHQFLKSNGQTQNKPSSFLGSLNGIVGIWSLKKWIFLATMFVVLSFFAVLMLRNPDRKIFEIDFEAMKSFLDRQKQAF